MGGLEGVPLQERIERSRKEVVREGLCRKNPACLSVCTFQGSEPKVVLLQRKKRLVVT